MALLWKIRKIHAPFAFDADLSQAPKLEDADLRGAKTDLRGADLKDANLMGADTRMRIGLEDADLRGAN